MAKSTTEHHDDRIRPSTDQLGALSWAEQIDLKEGDAVHTLQGQPSSLAHAAQSEFGPPPLHPNMMAAVTSVDFGSLRSFGPATPFSN